MVWASNATGEPAATTNSFTEVATGLHYWEDGQWKESQDLIELAGDGGAAAVRGPCKAYFPANLNGPEGIRFVTSKDRVFTTRPVGLFYYDSATGKAVCLGALQNCQGELYPPNQVIYRLALDRVQADLRLTYTKAAIESDLVLLQRPRPPEAYGLDPKTTKLELWHQCAGFPVPRQVLREDPDADFQDAFLDFGDMFFPSSRAFATEAEPQRDAETPAQVVLRDDSDPDSIAVAREWHEVDGSQILVERVRWEEIQPKLAGLPEAAQSGGEPTLKDRLLCMRDLDCL